MERLRSNYGIISKRRNTLVDIEKLKEEIHEVLWQIGGDTGWLDVRLEEVEKPIMDILDKQNTEN